MQIPSWIDQKHAENHQRLLNDPEAEAAWRVALAKAEAESRRRIARVTAENARHTHEMERVVCPCGGVQMYDGEPGWRWVPSTPEVFPGSMPDTPVCPKCPDEPERE